MPRYFIDTYDGVAAIDEVGHDLVDEAAMRALVQRSLAAMIVGETNNRSAAQLRANVRDEAGNHIMTATMSISVNWT